MTVRREAPPADPTRRCPLCGGDNRCGQPAPGSPDTGVCWCMGVVIAPDVLARVPSTLVDKACLCPRCAAADR